jgi:hypothetical protein
MIPSWAVDTPSQPTRAWTRSRNGPGTATPSIPLRLGSVGARFQSIRTESYQARASKNAAGSVQINPPWQR